MWQMEAVVASSMLAFGVLYHKGIKLWMAREGVSLVSLLGITLGIVTVVFLLLRDRIHLFGNRYALFFLLLYMWSALGLLFIASGKTNGFKLFLGLVLQAMIVYYLYRWV